MRERKNQVLEVIKVVDKGKIKKRVIDHEKNEEVIQNIGMMLDRSSCFDIF